MAQIGHVHAAVVASRTRANAHYRAAMEASPQYINAVALRATLLEAQQNLPGVPAAAAPDNPDADITAWLDTLAEADTAQRRRDVQTNALRDRIVWCDKIIEDVGTIETDRILAHLNDALADLMEQVAAVVDRLDGAQTPQQVIDAGLGDVWKELRLLRSEYDQIRAAQAWAMAGEDQNVGARSHYLLDDPLATDLALKNLDEVFPQWRDRDNRSVNLTDAPQQDPRPWPQDDIARLAWLSTSAAQPWIPTLSELHQLNQERAAQLNPTPDEEPPSLMREHPPVAKIR